MRGWRRELESVAGDVVGWLVMLVGGAACMHLRAVAWSILLVLVVRHRQNLAALHHVKLVGLLSIPLSRLMASSSPLVILERERGA